MSTEDIRWEQRFANYTKAFEKLEQAVRHLQKSSPSEKLPAGDELFRAEILKEGLIQRFEYTHELAWNVMKDYAAYQGNPDIGGSRDAVREAFRLKIISEGKVWMDMIGSRNRSSHTYNQGTADEIVQKICAEYYPVFLAFRDLMQVKKGQTDLPN